MKKRLEQTKTKQSVCSVTKIQVCFLGLNNIGSSGGTSLCSFWCSYPVASDTEPQHEPGLPHSIVNVWDAALAKGDSDWQDADTSRSPSLYDDLVHLHVTGMEQCLSSCTFTVTEGKEVLAFYIILTHTACASHVYLLPVAVESTPEVGDEYK